MKIIVATPDDAMRAVTVDIAARKVQVQSTNNLTIEAPAPAAKSQKWAGRLQRRKKTTDVIRLAAPFPALWQRSDSVQYISL